jgi:hypothetical protein
MTRVPFGAGDVRGREPRSARGALQRSGWSGHDRSAVITRATSIPATPWPAGWDDVEVVDSVLVDEPGAAAASAGLYDRLGRVTPGERYGGLVSVLA